jgi:hypothetical protein
MVQIVLIGIGAGVAAALLFASPLSGTALAFPLFALTGLPVAIAGLGWTPIAAGVATIVGGAIVLALFSPHGLGVFLLLFALPMTWLVRLAGLSRENQTGTEWFPLGRLLVHAAGAVAIGLTAVGYVVGFDAEALAASMTDALLEWMVASPELGPAPTREELEPFVRFNVAALPYSIAAIGLVIVVFDLWLAGVVTRASGRLARPREQLWTASMPAGAAVAFVVALAASFLPVPLASVAAVVAGAFGCGLALIGLAVLHALTIGSNARTVLLTITYFLLILLGFPILVFAALGLGETLLHLRARRFGGAPPAT